MHMSFFVEAVVGDDDVHGVKEGNRMSMLSCVHVGVCLNVCMYAYTCICNSVSESLLEMWVTVYSARVRVLSCWTGVCMCICT